MRPSRVMPVQYFLEGIQLYPAPCFDSAREVIFKYPIEIISRKGYCFALYKGSTISQLEIDLT